MSKQPQSHDIEAALQIVIELAFQNTIDRLENPTRYRQEMAAIDLVRDTFSRAGQLR
ncbi:MAG TPA: hypothetical protein VGH47_15970 [Xanthobacteraceae bacterium]|jgi:hypothetical protein